MDIEKLKRIAHQMVAQAVSRKQLPLIFKMQCRLCGGRAHAYHHENYNLPMDVVPLCAKCHSYVHGFRSEPNKEK